MSEAVRMETIETRHEGDQERSVANQDKRSDKQVWETPQMEDVSEQVMAQPYIRFT